jgi:oligoendopeptidase F
MSRLVLMLSLSLLLGARSIAAEAPVAAGKQLNWDLNDLYASPQAWQQEYERVTTAAKTLSRYQGKLGSSAGDLYAALDAVSRVTRDYLRVYVHASLRADEDLRVAANQEREQQVQTLDTTISEQTSWLAPEILAIGADKVRSFVAADPRLKQRFDFYLDNKLRGARHTLGLEAEGVLAAAGNVLQQPTTLHSQLSNAELPFPKVTLSTGEQVQLTTANYEKYRQTGNRADRKLVFDIFWSAWKQFEGTYGSMLTTHVMGSVFNARVRKFDGAMAAALFPANMPATVYRTLVSEANAALPTLHRYLKLRKRRLGISDELQYFDNYPPLFPLAKSPAFNLDDSKRITLEALKPLGEDYLSALRQGFTGQWMSVYPAPGKRSGAYMNGAAYDVHPFLLLNHNDDYQSLSTFAHEWGHAVHSLLTNRAQPFDKARYPTFIAESASIGNEMLLTDYLVSRAASRAEKLFYLGNAVEEIRQTYFRQVMFAEFELAVHEEVEQGRPLSGQRMTEMYCTLLRKYYGEAQGVMKIDPAYCIEWAYVPHFYYNFYLYQYATSMAGAAYLTDDILRQGVAARDRFLTLLRAGGSAYPYEMYQRAGLDMATGTAYRALAARMNRLLDEIEQLESQGDR